MGSQVGSAEEVNPASATGSEPKQSETEARVEAMWEKMNQGLSNKTVNSFSNKYTGSTAKTNTPQKPNDNWIKYLGLAQEGAGSSTQDAHQSKDRSVQNGASNEDKKVAAMWEQMNKGMPSKTYKIFLNNSCSPVDKSSQEKSDKWMGFLGVPTEETKSSEYNVPLKVSNGMQNDMGDEARKLAAAAALSAVKDAAAAAAAASGRGRVEITEVRDFAGQDIEIKKLVDAESKEAAEKAKAPSAVDAVLEQIRKKPKLSVLDKTKKDWGEFKDENKGLEDELDAYKKSSNQYLDKVSFLQRADYREFERERDARLAQQSRRRPDMQEGP